MDKKSFEKWLEEVRNYGIKPGLSRVKKLLELMDDPQNKLDIIHITGTNGKGSTATFLSNILCEANYKTGQFSSPSILGFNDMFRINNKEINDEKLFLIANKIKKYIKVMLEEGFEHPTEYEIISAIMYEYFYQEHVDFAIVEVAMGGENDCTNVMDYSILSIITPISLDHTSFLGNTLKDIATEKSGVIKNNSVVITHKQEKDVMDVLEKKADDKMSVLKIIKKGTNFLLNENYMTFDYNNLNIKSKLLGKHQKKNIICVIDAIENLNERGYVNISKEELLSGILKTKFEGRFEKISSKPIWIIDGAHNLESVRALKNNLEAFNYNNLIGIVGILKDKDLDIAFKEILPLFKKIIVTEPLSSRKLSALDLQNKIMSISDVKIESYIDIEDAINRVNDITNKDDIVIAFGSFYMISEIRKIKGVEHK